MLNIHMMAKKSKSTTTAGLAIQSALSKALDQGHFAKVATIMQISIFDMTIHYFSHQQTNLTLLRRRTFPNCKLVLQ